MKDTDRVYMRILCVQESDWFERGPLQSHHLMERLSNRGHDVRVIDFETHWREYERDGIISNRKIYKKVHKATEEADVTLIRPSLIKLPLFDYLSLLYTHRKEIKKQIAEFKPDVIIGFSILNSYMSINLVKDRNIPFVYYIIDELHKFVPQKAFQGLAKYIESQNLKNADKIISINEKLREYTINLGARKDHTDVVRGGVELNDFQDVNIDVINSIRNQYGIKNDDIVLFFMGILYDFSGLKEIAIELTKSKNEKIKLFILGKGNLWDTLNEIKEKNGIEDQIITLGWQPYQEVPKFIAASDICILPAHDVETMRNIVPIKLYEYMAASKPVICTKLPGIFQEFGDNNGVTYVEKSAEVLETAMQLFNENKIEEEGQKSMKFVAENNDWEKITDNFEKILEEVTK